MPHLRGLYELHGIRVKNNYNDKNRIGVQTVYYIGAQTGYYVEVQNGLCMTYEVQTVNEWTNSKRFILIHYIYINRNMIFIF